MAVLAMLQDADVLPPEDTPEAEPHHQGGHPISVGIYEER